MAVNTACSDVAGNLACMEQNKLRQRQGARLSASREAAGFKSARAAALECGWPESSYRSHEAGTRTIGLDDADKYAKRFQSAGVKVSARHILFGADSAGVVLTVPVVGYVGASATTHLFADGQGPFDEVPAPDGASERTVAVEIRGDSLGSFFDRWLVFYDDVHEPPRSELLGKPCIVGLVDGRVLIKKLTRGRDSSVFTLLSNVEAPIYDVRVAWAARVISMQPR